MVIREKYLEEIRGFYDSDLIKIITGVRRSGKSVILEQVMSEIGQKTDNIIALDFDDRATTGRINVWTDIVDYVDESRTDGFCYVFLDEVQEIPEWYMACRALRRQNCSVFVTGSNSKLLSGEFTKELSGRYVSFRVRPFVYRELQQYAHELGRDVSMMDYLVWGGFPKRLEFTGEKDQRRYLNDLDENIVMNDIIKRYQIRKADAFRRVADFVLISNARKCSAKSIADYMTGNGEPIGANTVQKWVDYLKEAYVIDSLPTFSRKAKARLARSDKLYDCDPALNSIRCQNGRYDLTHNLENIVYNELVYLGYEVYVYDNNGREIDFMAEKDGKKTYIQVSWSVLDEKTWQREFSAFGSLTQIDRKLLITNDELDYSTSNVTHIRLKDFLENGC